MRESLEGRLAEIHTDGKTVNVTFLGFGTIPYGYQEDGLFPVTRGIIEMPNGQVRMIAPDEIRFLPKPERVGNF